MEVIGLIYKYLLRVGITSKQSTKNHPFNIRNSAILFTFGMHVTFNMLYLFYGAANLNEYAESVYFTIMAISGGLVFAFGTWKMFEIFRFFEYLEDTINTRKCHIAMKNDFYK